MFFQSVKRVDPNTIPNIKQESCLVLMKRQLFCVIIECMRKRRNILLRITALVFALALMLSGCSASGAGSADDTDTDADITGQEPGGSYDETDYPDEMEGIVQAYAERDSEAEPVKRVGVAMPTRTSERWINDGMNIKARLETLGYEVDLQYADNDIELQISQIESMIRNEVDCLVLASIDSTRLVKVLRTAKDNGISVIAYDRLLMNTDAVSYYASFDNKEVGTLIGNYISDKMHLKEASSQGKSYTIEFFMGSPDDNNALFLYDGLMEVLKPYLDDGTLICRSGKTHFRDTCILRWSEETAKEMCSDLIKEYYENGDLDIACSAFDGFAYGILDAWRAARLPEEKLPLITGQDAERSAIKNIAEGRQDMTIYKDTRVLAAKCVTMVQALLENSEPEINDTKQYNNNVLTVPSYLCDPVIIDSDNYEEILIGGGYYTREQLFR